MTLKSHCCRRYKKKGKACSRCPKMARLTKKKRRAVLRKFKRR